MVGAPALMIEAGHVWLSEVLAAQGFKPSIAGFVALMVPIPFLMMSVARRLHDLNRSVAWMFVLVFLTAKVHDHFPRAAAAWGAAVEAVLWVLIGAGLLYLGLKRGDLGENRFGPDPLAAS